MRLTRRRSTLTRTLLLGPLIALAALTACTGGPTAHVPGQGSPGPTLSPTPTATATASAQVLARLRQYEATLDQMLSRPGPPPATMRSLSTAKLYAATAKSQQKIQPYFFTGSARRTYGRVTITGNTATVNECRDQHRQTIHYVASGRAQPLRQRKPWLLRVTLRRGSGVWLVDSYGYLKTC